MNAPRPKEDHVVMILLLFVPPIKRIFNDMVLVEGSECLLKGGGG